jgi:hypothetical protein
LIPSLPQHNDWKAGAGLRRQTCTSDRIRRIFAVLLPFVSTFLAATLSASAAPPLGGGVRAFPGALVTAATLLMQVPNQIPHLLRLELNPTNIYEFGFSTGIVTLDAPAPSEGLTVFLTSPNPAQAILPATVTVPAGDTTATFPVNTGKATTVTALTLSATANGITKTANLVIVPRNPTDFNSDGTSDLLLQNSQTGEVYIWLMNGLQSYSFIYISQINLPDWQVVAAADFNHDSRPDLVLQNRTTGAVKFRYLVNLFESGPESPPLYPGANYQVVGTGDFNGDGNTDLVFQNRINHDIVIWFMNGATFVGGAAVPSVPTDGYVVVGVGDFNGDGHPDLLFQNAITGRLVVWYMHGTVYAGGALLPSAPQPGWQVSAVADYNMDGMPDIVFQNTTTKQVNLWFMNGLRYTGGGLTSAPPLLGIRLVGPR